MIEIRKTKIYSLEGNLPGDLSGKVLVLAVDWASNEKAAKRIGFDDNAEEGDTILPSPIGPATKFNAYGKEIVRRDLPMKTHYRTQEWTHTEWRGRGETEEVTSLVDVPYKKYPRELKEGVGVELTVSVNNGQKLITTATPIAYVPENSEELKAAINVFLEIFGSVSVYDRNLEPILTKAELRRVNWLVLPPGKKITQEQLEAALNDVLSKSKRVRPVELLRQNKIIEFSPNVIAVGAAGFRGYVVYVFTDKKIAVLESIRYGNATYIIDSASWEQLSKFTKQQLIAAGQVNKRLIHTLGWFPRVNQLLGAAKPKPVETRKQ